jgi:hypothetical protein
LEGGRVAWDLNKESLAYFGRNKFNGKRFAGFGCLSHAAHAQWHHSNWTLILCGCERRRAKGTRKNGDRRDVEKKERGTKVGGEDGN